MVQVGTILLALLPLAQALPASTSQQLTARDEFKHQLDAYQTQASDNMKAILANRTSGCTLDKVVVRKEWNALSLAERVEYTDAVLCLRTKAPITPPSVGNGIKSRYDDFVAVHVNQSSFVHWTIYFLPWHRYLIHSYEVSLREECGYTGYQPYWDWSLNGGNITAQAMFSGEVGSLGGNGQYIPHGPSNVTIPSTPPQFVNIPAGTGGGCIQDGPFAGINVTMGPLGPPFSNNAFDDANAGCVTRDFRDGQLMGTSTYDKVAATVASIDIDAFSGGMDGLHGSGHTAIGGLQGDLFVSPSDPPFYHHHAQVDRLWAIWQGLDFENRRDAVTGTLTLMNTPPSAKGTINTPMDLGYIGGTKTAGELGSTIDGDFCYIYG
ncbi:related to monophenol monooxygenase (tyrosinase) [Rhynchosporium agropyri]|uniref:Related to monophenol monooxygenase (Tyrosinase) n=1 Tax=Rhynchosporium agropyri TaxID=914238 RepID=A0A1E1KGV6_9HELO|nr:related to monophenol monooxygenase (tyrosinase) [Rhynchosporium agropyri]